MSDLFREIDEELRRDQTLAFLNRYGLWLIVGGLLLVASIAGTMVFRDMQQEKNAKTTAALVQITGSGLYGDETKPDSAALLAFAAAHKGDLAMIAQMRAAAELARQGKDSDAVNIYQGLIDRPSFDPVLKNYVRYLHILRRVDHDKPDDLLEALRPLTEDKIWGPLAREIAGVLEFRAGRVERSLNILDNLVRDRTTPEGLRLRAAQLAALYRQSAPTQPTPPNS